MEKKAGRPYILLIEDSEIDAFITEKMIQLKHPELDVIKAKDGYKGLDFMEGHDKVENAPVSIFLDLQMPFCDGFKFMELYDKRFYSQLPSTSIYVLTSSHNSLDRKKSLKYPFVKGFIDKPLNNKKIGELTW